MQRIAAFIVLGVFIVTGIMCGMGTIGLADYKLLSFVLSMSYFICNGSALVISLKKITRA